MEVSRPNDRDFALKTYHAKELRCA